ncbi:MAG TPA: hypothetical protein VG826_24790 [Pirellulales bacterium]|nr:hypothetical protein [Pirellulales bacterium]
MSPAIGLAPMAFVAIVLFVVLLAAIVKGRIVSAILGFFGILLVMGGLLLVGGWVYLRQPVASQGPPPPFAQIWPIPRSAPPYKTIARASSQPLAERPDQSDNESVDKTAASAEASTDEPTGPRRPAWMDAPMGRVGDVYRTRATAGPWMSRTECERELADVLRDAVSTYADQLLGQGRGRFVNLPMSYILQNIVRGEWEERRQDTIHTMTSLHELLEFDREANQAIEASYHHSVVQSRLGYLLAGGGALVGLLTIVLGYLKLDTLTRGYYTGRLRLTALAAILALAVVTGLLVNGLLIDGAGRVLPP